MKTLPPGLADHIDQETTTLAWCWKLVRVDGTVMGFTDHDRDLSFDSVTFEAASGFTATEIASSLGLAVDNLEVEGALSAAALTEADLAAGRYDGAAVEIWRVNWADPGSGSGAGAYPQRLLMHKGSLGEVSRGELAFTAELRGLAHALQQISGRTYQRLCDADVGDARCGVNLNTAEFKGSGTVDAVSDDRILTVSGLGAFEANWFRFGKLTWTSGNNSGLIGEVKAHSKGASVVLSLWQRAPKAVQVGDTFEVTAGCDKTFETCKAKFDNVVNFRGFPHMPGNDRAFSYVVKESGEHDGGSFFN
jgi:uncharacterized phage protein (TIGR02218 family)